MHTLEMIETLPLDQVDRDAIESLLDAAFGVDRKSRTAYRLREGARWIDPLSFALQSEGRLVATIQCWAVVLTTPQGEKHDLILVGPVAVSPTHQNAGFGKNLMRLALESNAAQFALPMVMIGDPEYYQRFGFNAEATGGWSLPGPWEPHRLLLRNPHDTLLPRSGMLGPAHAI